MWRGLIILERMYVIFFFLMLVSELLVYGL